jgi:hypothetical protein
VRGWMNRGVPKVRDVAARSVRESERHFSEDAMPRRHGSEEGHWRRHFDRGCSCVIMGVGLTLRVMHDPDHAHE